MTTITNIEIFLVCRLSLQNAFIYSVALVYKETWRQGIENVLAVESCLGKMMFGMYTFRYLGIVQIERKFP